MPWAGSHFALIGAGGEGMRRFQRSGFRCARTAFDSAGRVRLKRTAAAAGTTARTLRRQARLAAVPLQELQRDHEFLRPRPLRILRSRAADQERGVQIGRNDRLKIQLHVSPNNCRSIADEGSPVGPPDFLCVIPPRGVSQLAPDGGLPAHYHRSRTRPRTTSG